MIGDGYTYVFICENAERPDGIEVDAGPIYREES